MVIIRTWFTLCGVYLIICDRFQIGLTASIGVVVGLPGCSVDFKFGRKLSFGTERMMLITPFIFYFIHSLVLVLVTHLCLYLHTSFVGKTFTLTMIVLLVGVIIILSFFAFLFLYHQQTDRDNN